MVYIYSYCEFVEKISFFKKQNMFYDKYQGFRLKPDVNLYSYLKREILEFLKKKTIFLKILL